jgi:hypothetical protein
MSDFDMDKLFDSSQTGNRKNNAFRQQVLQESTTALLKGRRIRTRLRISGLIMGILLVAAGSFICGQFSVSKQMVSSRISPEKGVIKTFANPATKEWQNVVNSKEESFWHTKALASVQSNPYKHCKTSGYNINMLEKYRQSIKEKHYE